MKDVPPHTVEMLDKSGKAKVRSTVSSRINYLALVNLKPGPMQDLRARQAIHHAVNVDELIQQVLRGRATKMCGALSPLNVDYSPKGECIKHDPARAQALFKEAGIDPTKLQLTLDTPSGVPSRQGHLPRISASSSASHQVTWSSTSGHAPGQEQEPHDGGPVLPRLGTALDAQNPSSSSSRPSRLTRPMATTRP